MKNQKYTWLGPIFIIIAGAINLFRDDIDQSLRITWWILTLIAVILTILGLWKHFCVPEEDTNKK